MQYAICKKKYNYTHEESEDVGKSTLPRHSTFSSTIVRINVSHIFDNMFHRYEIFENENKSK